MAAATEWPKVDEQTAELARLKGELGRIETEARSGLEKFWPV